MYCVEVCALLSEYLAKELDVVTELEITRHLDTCVDCSFRLLVLKRTVGSPTTGDGLNSSTTAVSESN